MIFALQLFLVHIVSYWCAVALYTIPWGQLEPTQWPKDAAHLVVKQVLKNQFVYTSVYIVPFAYYPTPLSGWHGVWQLPVIVVLTDVFFYVMHRVVHIKPLYKHIHAMHHDFKIPIAVAALYAHPLEHIFVNILIAVAPLFVVRANFIVAVLWTAIASVNTVVAHSATKKDQPHGLHHRYYNCNYGVGLFLMDHVFGTWRQQ